MINSNVTKQLHWKEWSVSVVGIRSVGGRGCGRGW